MLKKTNTKKPNFFIVGSPKAGTSSLHIYLQKHPEIFMSEPKEPGYFAKDKILDDTRFQNKEDYFNIFKNVKNEKIVGESSVCYSYSDAAIKLIKKEIKHPKIVFILRDPVGFITSAHSDQSIDNKNLKDLRSELNDEKEKIKKLGRISNNSLERTCYRYVLKKIYKNVKKYFDTFGRENVKIILQDEFKKNPEKIYVEILEFLGVDNSFRPEFKFYHQNKIRRSKRVENFRQKLRKLPSPIVKIIQKIVPEKLRTFISDFNFKFQSKKPMDKDLEKQIKKEFYNDIIKLGKVIKRDLRHWVRY